MKFFFNLYSNCISVSGSEQSIIIDFQNNEFINIPNLLFKVLQFTRNKTVSEIKNYFNNNLDEGINHYFDYLEKIGYGFYLHNIDNFPDMDLNWFSPLRVNSSVLEINANYNYNLISAIKELSSLGCSSVQIRINSGNIYQIISDIINSTRYSRIRNVEIILPEALFENKITKYLHDIENRITHFLIHSVENEQLTIEKYKDSKFFKEKRILFTSKLIDNTTNDVININNFVINLDFFCESQKHNVALNRKVCIDNDGNFKNFLAHESIHGNFNSKSITELIDDRDFTRKWFVSNDSIDICKDCQFRYICFDNSDIEFTGVSWKKVNQCQFDPYTNKWQREQDIL